MKDYDKHIRTLDGAIAQAKAQLSFNAGDGKSLHNRGESIKHMAKIVMKEICSPNIIVNAIQAIEFPSEYEDMFGGNYNTMEIREESRRTRYKQGVEAIITILQQEQERLDKQQQEEQQKSNKRMNKWTLIFSAIAALGTIATLLFTIFD
ncbi:MAG: hypothetical protein E7133_04195 [Rikenellaceae bacterium]|nr:hypothetical protein [Rikenellaceae bacterium]